MDRPTGFLLTQSAAKLIILPYIGDIVSVEIPGFPVVIINSYETVQDILAKRPGTTGGRKIGYMVFEL